MSVTFVGGKKKPQYDYLRYIGYWLLVVVGKERGRGNMVKIFEELKKRWRFI